MRNRSLSMLSALGRLILGLSFVGCLHALSTISAQAQVLPDVYDLRSAGPDGESWVPAVQDQSNLGDCWTFATTTALDSNLIVNGYLPTSTTAPAMAISNWHLTAYNGAVENTVSNGAAYSGLVGGDNWMTTSYYTRGQGSWPIVGATPGPQNITNMGGGPILVSSNPLNAFPLADVNAGNNLGADLPPVSQTPGFTVTGAYYFDQPNTGRDAAQQITVVKNALETYGALATYMYAGGYTLNNHKEQVFQYDTAGGYEYSYDPSPKQAEHVVTIIGWNDTITLPNQTTPGAWIVQNSWGAWGGTLAPNDGTFYAPYTDPYIGVQGVTAYTAVPAGKYSPFVLQNELGPTYQTGNWGTSTTHNPTGDVPTGMGIVDSSKATIALSKLTVTSPGTLLALGLTSLDAQPGASKPVTVTLYNGFSVVDGVGTPGALLETQVFTFLQEGYTLFDLETPLYLFQNEVLAVEVNYEGSSIPYVWESASDGGIDAPTGLTYFYNLNLGAWEDFATFTGTTANSYYDGVFSVKGLFAVPEPSQYGLLIFLAVAGVTGWRRWRLVGQAMGSSSFKF